MNPPGWPVFSQFGKARIQRAGTQQSPTDEDLSVETLTRSAGRIFEGDSR